MLAKLLVIAAICHLGHSARVISVGRTINVNPQQQVNEVAMICEIEFGSGENFFNKLVYWMKIQNLTILETFTSETVINTKLNNQDTTMSEDLERAISSVFTISSLAQPEEPFTDTNKFQVNLDANANTVTLAINNIDARDSGLYVCVLKDSNRVETVDFRLNILQPVTTLMLMGFPNASSNASMDMSQESTALIYYENVEGILSCRSEGGFPAPRLSVFTGEQRISGQLQTFTNYTMMGDLGGRQTIIPVRTVNSTTFRPRKEMNNQKIRCQAEVRTSNMTFSNKTVEKTLIVYYKPHIDCFNNKNKEDIKIPEGGAKISVKCEIRARPTPEISWTAERSRVKVMSNDNTNNDLGLKAVTEVSTTEDTMIATLHFDVVRSEHFQQYKIVAENVAGPTEMLVTIKNGELKVDTNVGGASTLSSAILLTVLAVVFQLLISLS